ECAEFMKTRLRLDNSQLQNNHQVNKHERRHEAS
ncbi:ABC transporter ATP-binding protein, partial [Vibrio alginolyticus]